MNKKTRYAVISLCLALVVAVSFCVALLAGAASEDSVIRLVSFDYIENTLFGYINDGDDALDKEITALKGQLLLAEKEIEKLEEQLGAGGEFRSLTLNRGESLNVLTGCELVVVSGRLELSEGLLCDLTTGTNLEKEEKIQCSHSIVAANDSKISVSSSEVVILIRGEYTNG